MAFLVKCLNLVASQIDSVICLISCKSYCLWIFLQTVSSHPAAKADDYHPHRDVSPRRLPRSRWAALTRGPASSAAIRLRLEAPRVGVARSEPLCLRVGEVGAGCCGEVGTADGSRGDRPPPPSIRVIAASRYLAARFRATSEIQREMVQGDV